jgi:hypothetical protein
MSDGITEAWRGSYFKNPENIGEKVSDIRKEKPIIYIASPYTVGDKLENVKLQIEAWHILRDKGFIPIAPLLSHYLEEFRHREYLDYLDYDFAIISLCNIVVRIRPHIDGVEIPSSGADQEEKESKRLGIRFLSFNSLNELRDYQNW